MSTLTIPADLQAKLAFDVTLMPDELKAFPHWVMWTYHMEGNRWTKNPMYLTQGGHIKKAATSRPAEWMPYGLAVETAQAHGLGIGFVLSKMPGHENPFLFIDIDKDPNDPQVTDLIIDLATYTEYSPSGNGLHMIVNGRLPGQGNRRGPFEMYETGRWMTMTGNQVPGTNLLIAEANDAVGRFHHEFIRDNKPPINPEIIKNFKRVESVNTVEDVLALADQAPRGSRSWRFANLYRTAHAEGYANPNKSDQDWYFLIMAAELAGNNPELIDQLYRTSAIWNLERRREKWERLGPSQIQDTMELAAANLDAQRRAIPRVYEGYAESTVHDIPRRAAT